MIQRILALSLASCFAIAISASSDQPAAPSTGVGKLTVVPVGLEKDRGNAMIQLARGEADFEGEGEPFRFAIVKVENKEAVAETIENNVRMVIIDKHPINPKYYDRMSAL